MLPCYTTHLSNIYHSLGQCYYSNISNILHFSNIYQWEFNIIIIFNAITLALQPSRVRWLNLYLILKPFFFASIGKLYDNSYLP